MKELLKDLRNKTNEELIERLNYNQQKFNKFTELYGLGIRDRSTTYSLDTYNNNIDKIKKVLNERNIKIEFINGWEIRGE